MNDLREDCFRAWPSESAAPAASTPVSTAAQGIRLTATTFTSEDPFQPTLWILHRDDAKPEDLSLVVLNESPSIAAYGPGSRRR